MPVYSPDEMVSACKALSPARHLSCMEYRGLNKQSLVLGCFIFMTTRKRNPKIGLVVINQVTRTFCGSRSVR